MVVDPLPEVVFPLLLGLIIPFISHFLKNPNLQTIANIVLSAAAAAVPTIPTGLDWRSYLIAFASAWLATMRADYTNLPAKIYSGRVTRGRHEKLDDGPSPSYHNVHSIRGGDES